MHLVLLVGLNVRDAKSVIRKIDVSFVQKLEHQTNNPC